MYILGSLIALAQGQIPQVASTGLINSQKKKLEVIKMWRAFSAQGNGWELPLPCKNSGKQICCQRRIGTRRKVTGNSFHPGDGNAWIHLEFSLFCEIF